MRRKYEYSLGGVKKIISGYEWEGESRPLSAMAAAISYV
jgi:hypothetical protein